MAETKTRAPRLTGQDKALRDALNVTDSPIYLEKVNGRTWIGNRYGFTTATPGVLEWLRHVAGSAEVGVYWVEGKGKVARLQQSTPPIQRIIDDSLAKESHSIEVESPMAGESDYYKVSGNVWGLNKKLRAAFLPEGSTLMTESNGTMKPVSAYDGMLLVGVLMPHRV